MKVTYYPEVDVVRIQLKSAPIEESDETTALLHCGPLDSP